MYMTSQLRSISVFLDQDPKDPNHIWIDVQPGIRHQNWEAYEAIDWDKLIQRLLDELKKPPPNENSFIIMEGHILYYNK